MGSETFQVPEDSEHSEHSEHPENSMGRHHLGRRRPYVMAASLLLSAGLLTFGLVQIGHGIAAKGADTITVTGSARVPVSADNAVWLLSIQESGNSAATAIAKAESGVKSITDYFTKQGIPASAIEIGGIYTSQMLEYFNGNPTGKVASYQASRDVTLRYSDVAKVALLSQGIGEVLQSGVNSVSSGPAYYVSNLSILRPKLLADAMKDARIRAGAITEGSGTTVGSVKSVRSGPFQVTAADSVDATDGGTYDTRTIKKSVTATITADFIVK